MPETLEQQTGWKWWGKVPEAGGPGLPSAGAPHLPTPTPLSLRWHWGQRPGFPGNGQAQLVGQHVSLYLKAISSFQSPASNPEHNLCPLVIAKKATLKIPSEYWG